jgi:FkbM family methyltransferase
MTKIKKQPTQIIQTNTAVQMYRRDMSKWVKDTSMCIGPSNFLKANMHTNAGDVAIFVHEPSVDVHVSGSLVRGGSWEPHLIQLMFSLLNQDPNLQFIDLGANLGVFSLAVAKYGRKVVAVEPLSINLHRFCASITANRFENIITVVTNALSDKRENVTFGKDQGNVGGTFVLNDKNMNKFNGSPVKGKYDDVVLSAHLDDVLNLPKVALNTIYTP